MGLKIIILTDYREEYFLCKTRKKHNITVFFFSIHNKPFPKRQILDSSKLKEYADDNFEFDENYRMFSKWVENTVGKGEIARYEQFLLFPQRFLKTYSADT